MADSNTKFNCKVCSFELTESRWWRHTSDEVNEAAENGCPTCFMISEGINRVVANIDTGLKPLILKAEKSPQGSRQVWRVTAVFDFPDEDIDIDFYTIADSPAPEPWDKLQATTHVEIPPSQSLQSKWERTLRWLKQQVEDCRRDHPICVQKLNERKALPKRLLDLGPGLSNFSIRLFEPDADFIEPYMTLSHRWGRVQLTSTTKSNKMERYEEIKLEELPKTFLDAVKITRCLGVRFLWIDSLCIVQDDPEDWEVEASQMASIYEGSYLTIAATSSRDSRGGCIIEAPGFSRVDTRAEKGKSIYVRQTPLEVDLNRAHLEIKGDWNQLQNPLLSRAWVYQERILSPRVVHFHKAELFWECKSCLKCECGKCSSQLSTEENTELARADIDKVEPGSLRDAWREVISTYSFLLLTNHLDKLPALSGIATLFSTKLGNSEYLAGTWRALLPEGLCWHVDANSSYIENSMAVYQAPTWSWASINYPVVQTHAVRHKCFEVLDVWCRVLGQNPYGRVVDGCLKIKAWYMRGPTMRNIPRQNDALALRFYDLDLYFRYYPDNIAACKALKDWQVQPWILIYIAYDQNWGINVMVLKESEKRENCYERIRFAIGSVPDEVWIKDSPMKTFSII